jgi:hypothetical protein
MSHIYSHRFNEYFLWFRKRPCVCASLFFFVMGIKTFIQRSSQILPGQHSTHLGVTKPSTWSIPTEWWRETKKITLYVWYIQTFLRSNNTLLWLWGMELLSSRTQYSCLTVPENEIRLLSHFLPKNLTISNNEPNLSVATTWMVAAFFLAYLHLRSKGCPIAIRSCDFNLCL